MVHCRANWTYLHYGITVRAQSIKGTTQKGPTVRMSFLQSACGCEYACGQMQNLILPSWIFGMGVHRDIFTTLTLAGFMFLSNCTAWCVLRGFHENDESLISTMLQLWGNMGIHFEAVHSWLDWNNRNRKQKQGARVKISLKYQPIMKKSPYS